MGTHQESKTVIRYEAWCDDCAWTAEFADPEECFAARTRHANHHSVAGGDKIHGVRQYGDIDG